MINRRLPNVWLRNNPPNNGGGGNCEFLLLESGDFLLLEDNYSDGKIALNCQGCTCPVGDFLLETGDFLLLETGDKLELNQNG